MRTPLAVAFLIVLLGGCTGAPAPGAGTGPADAPDGKVTLPGAILDTDQGTITWVFYPEAAPATVEHISALIAAGYYDGKGFGRVVPGHVIQQAGPDGGTVTDDKATVPLEAPPGYHFSAGAVGIARGADPGSGGPEFFIMDYATSHLDGNYTVFAQVVQGMDVVHRIARVPAIAFPAEAQVTTDRAPVAPPLILSATLTDVVLDGRVAAQLPREVARNVRTGDFRHSLEWPHDLAAGHESRLTWYIRPYNGTASPDPARLALSVEGEPVALTPEVGLPEVLAFRWTPPSAGEHPATLALDGKPLATLAIRVQVP